MDGIYLIIILLIIIYVIIYKLNSITESFDNCVIENPQYLKQSPSQSDLYDASVMNDQMHEIRRLRGQVQKLAEIIDEGNEFKLRKYYSRKLSNKYYKVMPYMAVGVNNGTSLNLYDDDFSNKTLSTIKFLSQTRKSNFFGNEVHFPTELCGNFCSTSDPNAAYHEQIDLVRPIVPPNIIPREK